MALQCAPSYCIKSTYQGMGKVKLKVDLAVVTKADARLLNLLCHERFHDTGSKYDIWEQYSIKNGENMAYK